MIGHMSYHGMPSHYNHWSFGKTFERTHQMYNLGMEGLPYELIINSDPSIAYLMKQNDLFLQILIMAHCVGHSDFFKIIECLRTPGLNLLYLDLEMQKKEYKEYVRKSTHRIMKKVENFLMLFTPLNFKQIELGYLRKSREEIKKSLIDEINQNIIENQDKNKRCKFLISKENI